MTQFASTLYPQTNPTNPILMDIRDHYRGDWVTMHKHYEKFVGYIGHYVTKDFMFIDDPQQIDHARRVLTRLAALTG